MVSAGWEPEYVLNMEIPVFQDYLKVVQRNKISERCGEFQDITVAIGTAFSKNAKVEDYTNGLMDLTKD